MKRKVSPLGEMKTPTCFRDFAKRNELGWDPIRENMVFEAVSFTVSDQKIFKHSSLAQSVEHLTVNQGVTGSSPVGGAILIGQKCNLCQKALFYKAFSVF